MIRVPKINNKQIINKNKTKKKHKIPFYFFSAYKYTQQLHVKVYINYPDKKNNKQIEFVMF